ncbi:alcohol dehydrogenase catalytic domain-containing protein [Microbacterium sp. NEAU-LLC]|uniref:Alcohol dehydrogenase catalytic domain-containing protein n=1 Tax=Microbacterium helvum TaxID=2773713 RepID=A0ABR8NPV6_9MICO|nr:alcohol dehydrogenase catalytic domain-containing protein [Microbacterium helvum]MBD3942675.1 alcohol dehydrogenase catalytic domain-containing protein [Microbacterium helvum]
MLTITGAVLEEVGRPRPFSTSRPLTVSELTLDPPGPDEILVRIEAAGICHSDLSVADGNRVRPTPMLLGHEAAGIVEGLGDNVDDLHIGDRVVLTFLPLCGECDGCRSHGRLPCERGAEANGAGALMGGGRRLRRNGTPVHHHLGVSGFSTHAVVHRSSAVRVAPDVPAEVAALLGCAVLTGGGAVINAGRPEPGETVMVVGLGGVGLAAVLVALAERHPVIAVDALESKLAVARELGAQQVLTPAQLAESGQRAPVVIEAAGHPRAFETAFAATAPGGTTVTVGLPAPSARSEISPLAVTTEARRIVGSYLGSSVPARDIPRYADLWRNGNLPVERLISGRVGFDDLNAAMDALADGRALRQILVPSPSTRRDPA